MTRQRWLVGLTEYAGVTPYTGGIGRHYASLLPALVRAGVDIDLAVFDRATPILSADLGGVRLVAHLRSPRTPTVALPIARALAFRRLATRRPYDRVFLPEWGGIAGLLPASTPLVTNLATSMRLSNAVSGIDPARLSASRRRIVAVQNWAEDRQIRRSHGVVPISHAMLARTGELLGRLPESIVVRNCIDVGAVQEASLVAPLPSGWPTEDRPVVLFLGRLERRKGVVSAVEAFGLIVEQHPDAHLVLAGSSGDSRFEPTRSDLLGAVPVEFRDRVGFLGHVPGAELYRAIAASTVVLCPSLWEGFGQVALETKAIGRAMIVTSGSGYDDFCVDGDDCLAVVPGDSGALANAIHRLLIDPALRARLGDTARTGMGRFTADSVAPDLLSAVSELAATASPTRRRRA